MPYHPNGIEKNRNRPRECNHNEEEHHGDEQVAIGEYRLQSDGVEECAFYHLQVAGEQQHHQKCDACGYCGERNHLQGVAPAVHAFGEAENQARQSHDNQSCVSGEHNECRSSYHKQHAVALAAASHPVVECDIRQDEHSRGEHHRCGCEAHETHKCGGEKQQRRQERGVEVVVGAVKAKQAQSEYPRNYRRWQPEQKQNIDIGKQHCEQIDNVGINARHHVVSR